MIALINNTVIDRINLDWLTGPFLNKELRVSSRHRRNYLLRTAYITLLLFFVAMTWFNVVQSRNITFQKSRLAQAGREIIVSIVWFQFIAAQLAAVVMFCNSISDEIYHRTLGVLLTTPVSSFQIVIGKLLSKLFQILLLLAISLPLLAIVRVFGGISWYYILSSLCITLTAVIFAASVSMFFSVLFKRAYIVIIVTVVFIGILYGLSPAASSVLSGTFRFRLNVSDASFFRINPVFALSKISDEMIRPGRARAGLTWIIYCFFILFDSFILLFVSARILRSIALAHAVGQKSFLEKIFSRKKLLYSRSPNPKKSESDNKIRHIWGPPIAWKEMKTKFSSREKMFVSIIVGIEIIMIIAMYLFPYVAAGFGYDEAHWFYIYMFMGLSVLSTAIFSATCITSEKEAQTWPLLLTTTLSDWEIISGKFVGILRRCLPVWIMLLIYFIPFTGPFSLLLLTMLVIEMIMFLSSAGIYFSSRFKSTSLAFLGNFVLIAVIWFILPVILDYISNGNYTRYFRYRDIFDNSWLINPFMQAITITTSGYGLRSTSLRWPDGSRDIFASIMMMSYIFTAYIIAGSVFLWRARCRFRKVIL